MNNHHISITPISSQDWNSIALIQSECYVSDDILEPITVLQSKWHASPKTCFVARQDGRTHQDSMVLGYVLAHLWQGTPPSLSHAFEKAQLPKPPYDNQIYLYLHDMAISPKARGMGLASQLLQRLLAESQAMGIYDVRLIAVQSAEHYWEKQGFTPMTSISDTTQHYLQQSYGEDCVLMYQNLRSKCL